MNTYDWNMNIDSWNMNISDSILFHSTPFMLS